MLTREAHGLGVDGLFEQRARHAGVSETLVAHGRFKDERQGLMRA